MLAKEFLANLGSTGAEVVRRKCYSNNSNEFKTDFLHKISKTQGPGGLHLQSGKNNGH